ncbi:MAG TPA: cyclic nucleotide-binding domain-containing protein [Xanthobacteraceae bacterium]
MPMQPNLRSVSSTQSERRDARPAPPMHSLTSPIEMMGAPMTFRRNGEIYGEGEPADCACKIVSGAVRTSKGLADGRRQIGAFYLAGDVFGLEVGEEHGFSAEAITESKVPVIELPNSRRVAPRNRPALRQMNA